MEAASMQDPQNNAQRALIATLSATLDELCGLLSAFPAQMSHEECEALAVAAISGHGEAEFMVGCVFAACDQPNRAMEWYFHSASHNYTPAKLQLFALR
jgi:hypothetical protein